MLKDKDLKKFFDKDNAEEGTVASMVNRYGTYNIQPTCDMENDFPKISQGNPTN